MTAVNTGAPAVGRGPRDQPGFIQRHGLWNQEQEAAAEQVREQIKANGLRHIRLSWCDQHGIARGKTLTVREAMRALRDGKDFQFVTALFDTTNHPIVPPFGAGGFAGVPELDGLPDGVLVPDPATFRVLPWVDDTGWMLCDAYFSNGRELPFSTRGVLRRQLEALTEAGFDYITGLEFEFYVFRLEDPKLAMHEVGYPPEPPAVSALAHGFQYLTESRGDEVHDLLAILQGHVEALGLPLLTVEDEWGPGQLEFTFAPQAGLKSADDAVLFRTAIKQVCRRLGYHATFMARPAFEHCFSTGWHLHQSLQPAGTADNAFADQDAAECLSPLGYQWLAGLLEHAVPASVFTTPTINGYKRYRPDSFAPDRVSWDSENRGSMLRVIGEPGAPDSHIENRIGDPAANPYLYLASQVASGLDGIRRGLTPPAAVAEPYKSAAPRLPASLMDAVSALDSDRFFRAALGSTFIDYLVKLKEFEIGRFLQHVTDWEHREYFEMY
jgi:glutamine synthetase